MTRFLSRLWNPSNNSTPEQSDSQLAAEEVPTRLPDALGADEYVARFVFQERYIDKKYGNVKWQGFMPELYQGVHETSVCRNTGVHDSRVWEISRTCRSDKQALARADVGVDIAHQAQLMAHAAPQPNYSEHAVILGWPSIVNEDKSAQMLAAQTLAAGAHTAVAPKLEVTETAAATLPKS